MQAISETSEDFSVTAAYHCKVVVVCEPCRPCVAVQSQTDDKQNGTYTHMLHEYFSDLLRAAADEVDSVFCMHAILSSGRIKLESAGHHSDAMHRKLRTDAV